MLTHPQHDAVIKSCRPSLWTSHDEQLTIEASHRHVTVSPTRQDLQILRFHPPSAAVFGHR